MKTVKKIVNLFKNKYVGSTPLLIIKKGTSDANESEYQSIEDAISDLENDPNVPADKIEKLKSSFLNLKNKTSITIRNGEIIL